MRCLDGRSGQPVAGLRSDGDPHRDTPEGVEGVAIRRVPRLGQRNALADVEAGKERRDEPAGCTTDDADAMRVDTAAVAFVVVTNDARPEIRKAGRGGVAEGSPGQRFGGRNSIRPACHRWAGRPLVHRSGSALNVDDRPNLVKTTESPTTTFQVLLRRCTRCRTR